MIEDKINLTQGQSEKTLEEEHADLQQLFMEYKQEHRICGISSSEALGVLSRQNREFQRNLKDTFTENAFYKKKVEIADQEKILWLAELKKLTSQRDKLQKRFDEMLEKMEATKKRNAKKKKAL